MRAEVPTYSMATPRTATRSPKRPGKDQQATRSNFIPPEAPDNKRGATSRPEDPAPKAKAKASVPVKADKRSKSEEATDAAKKKKVESQAEKAKAASEAKKAKASAEAAAEARRSATAMEKEDKAAKDKKLRAENEERIKKSFRIFEPVLA